MKLFSARWFDVFNTWPDSYLRRHNPRVWCSWHMLETAFNFSFPKSGKVSDSNFSSQPDHEPAFEVFVRRWLKARPKDAEEIVRRIQAKQWQANPGSNTPAHPGEVSDAFLLLWARLDHPGLAEWVKRHEATEPDLARRAKGPLLSFVSEEVRSNWVTQSLPEDREDALRTFAPWQPEWAMDQAVALKDPGCIESVMNASIYNFWNGAAHNTCHRGCEFLSRYDMRKIPENIRVEALGRNCTTLMELWGDVDSGACARFGMSILPLIYDAADREEMLKTLRGEIVSADNDDPWDRTFCALRVWAVMRPEEMREWIAKQPEKEMREALTHLLENPWGR